MRVRVLGCGVGKRGGCFWSCVEFWKGLGLGFRV